VAAATGITSDAPTTIGQTALKTLRMAPYRRQFCRLRVGTAVLLGLDRT